MIFSMERFDFGSHVCSHFSPWPDPRSEQVLIFMVSSLRLGPTICFLHYRFSCWLSPPTAGFLIRPDSWALSLFGVSVRLLVGLGAACSMFFVFSSSDFPVCTERSYAARSHLLRAAAGGGLGFSQSALTPSVWFSSTARQVLDSLSLLHD
jgi:hypothetical protein